MNDSQVYVPKNYQYWRDHGSEWFDEYERRQKYMLCYHIQRVMLADYMRHSRPARVIEFGCGPGRHLKYLSRIEGIDVYGYDQSAAMVSGCLRWTTSEWIAEHVIVGEPVGPLPYPDRHFDIVYTVEALIHTRPEDVGVVLAELVRVSKWQVLHLEPAQGVQIFEDAHDGSWCHDIVAAYRQLGYECEVLPSGYIVQQPYRVILDPARPVYTWPSDMLDLLRRMESDIQPTLDQLAQNINDLSSQIVNLRAELAEAEARGRQMQQQWEATQAALKEEQRKNRQLAQNINNLSSQIVNLRAELEEAEARGQQMQQQWEATQAALEEEQRKNRILMYQQARFEEFINQLRYALKMPIE
jgi:SAM-dependent methyltransferase